MNDERTRQRLTHDCLTEPLLIADLHECHTSYAHHHDRRYNIEEDVRN
jgi:ribosomal protein L32